MPPPDPQPPQRASWKQIGPPLLICLVFVGIGIPMSISGHPVGFVGVAFFGLGAVALASQLLPGMSGLRIDDEGLHVKRFRRFKRIPWRDIDFFDVVETKHNGLRVHRVVGWRLVPEAAGASRVKRLNRGLTGVDETLPHNFGWKPVELADHLNRQLEAARVGRAVSSGA